MFIVGMACGWQARNRLHPIPRAERQRYWRAPLPPDEPADEPPDEPPLARRVEIVSEVEALPLFEPERSRRR